MCMKKGLPQVKLNQTTNGRWDLIMAMGTHKLEEVDIVLTEFPNFGGYQSTRPIF